VIDLLYAISQKDHQLLVLAIDHFLHQASPTKNELIEIIASFPLLVENYPEPVALIAPSKKDKKITWFIYEELIWGIGEAFRHILQAKKNLCKEPDLYKAIEKTTVDKTYGKGRQSFIMLLPLFNRFDSTQLLRSLLKDKDIDGHVIYTARKLRIIELQEEIRPFLDCQITWIRNEAKKYFSSIQKPTAKA